MLPTAPGDFAAYASHYRRDFEKTVCPSLKRPSNSKGESSGTPNLYVQELLLQED
jgi:hypothetical protein